MIILYINVPPLLIVFVSHGFHLRVTSLYWEAQREPGIEESNLASHKIRKDKFAFVTSYLVGYLWTGCPSLLLPLNF